MEKTIEIKEAYNSLDKLLEFLKTESTFECSKEWDKWNHRTDSNNQMEKSIVIKKSAIHGINAYFIKGNMLKIKYIIPNTIANAYLSKSQKARRSIIEIIIGKIMQALLSGPQKKAFEEIEQVFKKIVA